LSRFWKRRLRKADFMNCPRTNQKCWPSCPKLLNPLPEGLRREDIVIEPSESTQDCVKIGEEVTEVLEIVPASFYVKRYIRPRYARANGEGILIGTLPDRVIEKGIPSESVVAQMTVDKYVYGMPLHRQLDKYSKMGIRIPASSASDWIMAGWERLTPLWELLRLMVLNQKYLQVDETPIKVLDRDNKNGIHQGYMWLYHARWTGWSCLTTAGAGINPAPKPCWQTSKGSSRPMATVCMMPCLKTTPIST
jgi:transposase